MTLRQNVRNFLVGLTLSEMRVVLEDAITRGQSDRAKYIAEFIREVESEG